MEINLLYLVDLMEPLYHHQVHFVSMDIVHFERLPSDRVTLWQSKLNYSHMNHAGNKENTCAVNSDVIS